MNFAHTERNIRRAGAQSPALIMLQGGLGNRGGQSAFFSRREGEVNVNSQHTRWRLTVSAEGHLCLLWEVSTADWCHQVLHPPLYNRPVVFSAWVELETDNLHRKLIKGTGRCLGKWAFFAFLQQIRWGDYNCHFCTVNMKLHWNKRRIVTPTDNTQMKFISNSSCVDITCWI